MAGNLKKFYKPCMHRPCEQHINFGWCHDGMDGDGARGPIYVIMHHIYIAVPFCGPLLPQYKDAWLYEDIY